MSHALDDLLGAQEAVAVVRVDVHAAVVLDVNLGAGLGHDAFDGLAARSDDEADLVGIDADGFDARRVLGELRARRGERALHDVQNLEPRVARDVDGFLHNLQADARQLEVELEAGDAARGAAELEIHVAEMIFAADDVGEERVAIQAAIRAELGDEAAGDAGDGRLDAARRRP